MIFTLVTEGDSLSATVTTPSYFYVAAGVTGDDIPGSATFASFSYRDWAFPFDADTLGVNLSKAGSRILTNPTDLIHRTDEVDAMVREGYPFSGRPLTEWSDKRPERKPILNVLIGTNQDTDDPEEHAFNLVNYLEPRVEAGYAGLILGSIPDRADDVFPDFNSGYSTPFNAIVRSSEFRGQFGIPCVCADYGAIPQLGAEGAAEDENYFLDFVHPTLAGNTLMANEFVTKYQVLKRMLT